MYAADWLVKIDVNELLVISAIVDDKKNIKTTYMWVA